MSKKRKTDDENKENPLKLSKVPLCEDCIEDMSLKVTQIFYYNPFTSLYEDCGRSYHFSSRNHG